MRLLTHKDIKFFQSDLLRENNFIHAFFTKRSNHNEPAELQNQLNLFSNIHYAKQVHSDKVIQVNNTLNSNSKIADSLITKEQSQSLWIYSAECIPILIADVRTRNIAACHCGLTGIKKQIISKTLKRLEDIGSKKDDLIFAIGPCIKGDKYQVEQKDVEDLSIQLTGKSLSLNKIEKGIMIPLFKNDTKPNKIFIDIQSAAILQLFKEQIKQHQINLNKICTYSNPNLFNSYRRDKTNSRQWSYIYS